MDVSMVQCTHGTKYLLKHVDARWCHWCYQSTSSKGSKVSDLTHVHDVAGSKIFCKQNEHPHPENIFMIARCISRYYRSV